MRATLEQLKAMSDFDLYQHWNKSKFPFDQTEGCGHCLTMHRYYQLNHTFSQCNLPRHEDLLANVAKFGKYPNGVMLREHLEELYALRLFYDSLYPPSEETLSPTEAPAEEAASAEVRRENAGR